MSFQILDNYAILNILKYLEPKDILNMYQINKWLNNVLKNVDIIKRLLDLHYPESFYTDCPWKQYIALTMNVYTFYKIPDIILFVNAKKGSTYPLTKIGNQYCTIVKHDLTNEFIGDEYIWIPGLPLSNGHKLWIYYFDCEDYELCSFKTKESLAAKVVDSTYKYQFQSLKEHFIDNQDNFSYDCKYPSFNNDPKFIDFLTKYKTHNGYKIDPNMIPFTKKNYFDAIMKTNFVDTFCNWDAYYIFEIEF